VRVKMPDNFKDCLMFWPIVVCF